MAARIIALFGVQVEAIKRVGPSTYEVRAFILPAPKETTELHATFDRDGRKDRPLGGSVFFDMEDPEKAPTIFQRLVVTIEASDDSEAIEHEIL